MPHSPSGLLTKTSVALSGMLFPGLWLSEAGKCLILLSRDNVKELVVMRCCSDCILSIDSAELAGCGSLMEGCSMCILSVDFT